MPKTTLTPDKYIEFNSKKKQTIKVEKKTSIPLLTHFQLGCLIEKRKFIENDLTKPCEFVPK